MDCRACQTDAVGESPEAQSLQLGFERPEDSCGAGDDLDPGLPARRAKGLFLFTAKSASYFREAPRKFFTADHTPTRKEVIVLMPKKSWEAIGVYNLEAAPAECLHPTPKAIIEI
jgi:hypothetical protein